MSGDYRTPTVSYTDEFVALAHQGQPYGEEPYVNHVRRVAERLRPHGEWAYMAGLLHDAVEDTSVTLELLGDLGYPDVVVDAVDAVTLREGEDYMDLIARAAAHPLGCLVKLADNLDNSASLGDLARYDPTRAQRLRAKYTGARTVLMTAMVNHEAAAQREGRGGFGPAMPKWTDECRPLAT